MGEDEACYAAAIGPNWREYYRPRFVAIATGQRRLFWNWTAVLVPFWTQYRKLHLSALLYVGFMVGVASIAVSAYDWFKPGTSAMLGYGLMVLVLALIEGEFGTLWLFAHTRRQVRRARTRSANAAEAVAALGKAAPRQGTGPYLVHGLMTIILGVWGFLSAILPGGMMRSQESPFRAGMRSDLRNLVDAERAFHERQGRFVALDSLDFRTSSFVRVTIEEVSAEGFRARATAEQAPRWSCTIFVGVVRDVPPDAVEGEPLCIRRVGR